MNSTQTKPLHDLKINGSGSASGGTFNAVKISGSGKIVGDIDCKEVKISGSGKIEGNIHTIELKTSGSSRLNGDVTAKEIEISGSTKVEGNVIVEDMTVSGSSKFLQDITCKEFEVNGSSQVEGNVSGREVTSNGLLKIMNDCDVHHLKSRGSIHIDGALNASQVDIGLDFKSTIKSISGDTITVKQYSSINIIKQIINFFLQREDFLLSDTIEGKDIHLEHTKAKLVRGHNIVIGKKCEIEKVEYTGSLSIEDQSSVKTTERK